MADFLPWERYPDLAMERLIRVAEIIRDARHTAVLSHDRSLGDDMWTLGTVCYRRSCFGLEQASCADCDWLRILVEDNNRFTFAIGSIPLKFYKGSPDDPPSRSLAISYAELSKIQMSLWSGMIPDDEHILRLAVEPDALGEAKNISVVELLEGNVTNTYLIPLEAFSRSGVIPMQSKPIDIGPPTFTALEQEKEQKGERGESNAR